jgi:hypothetical protein
MMNILIIALFATLAARTPATATTHGATQSSPRPRASCTNATDGFDDGCSAAPRGAYRFPGGFVRLLPLGAKAFVAAGKISNRPYRGDAAGLDYGIGNITPIDRLSDPATAPLPRGCVFNAKSLRTPMGAAGAPSVFCRARRAGESLTFSGFNMALHGGVWLELMGPPGCRPGKAAQASAVNVTNDNFALGPSMAAAKPGLASLVKFEASGCSIDVTYANDRFDGGAPRISPGGQLIRDGRGSGNTMIRYNVWLNPGGRTMSGPYGIAGVQPSPGHCDFTAEYNFVYGNVLNYPINGDHGEFNEFGGSNPPVVCNVSYIGNLIVQPQSAPASTTALIWPSDGGKPMTGQNLTVANNILIANLGPGAPRSAGPGHARTGSMTASRVFGLGGTAWRSVTFAGNRVWAAGAWFCFAMDRSKVGATTWGAGKDANINLYDGSTISDYDGYPRPPCHGTWGRPR